MPIIGTDTALAVEYTKARAKEVGKCRVHISGACTKGLKGESLAEMGDMYMHGAVAFTDDGRGVQGAGMMRRVMDYASQFGKVVMSHCQDEDLVGKGQVNEGVVSTRLGVAGWPAEGEELLNYWFSGFYPAEQPRYTITVLQDGVLEPATSSAAIFARIANALHVLENSY